MQLPGKGDGSETMERVDSSELKLDFESGIAQHSEASSKRSSNTYHYRD